MLCSVSNAQKAGAEFCRCCGLQPLLQFESMNQQACAKHELFQVILRQQKPSPRGISGLYVIIRSIVCLVAPIQCGQSLNFQPI